MRPVDETLIAEAGRRLAAAGPDAQVILFGSHARGEASPQSDVDFLVVEPEVANEAEKWWACTGPCAICGCQQMSSSSAATMPTVGGRCPVASSTQPFRRAVSSADD
jgi:hypothetical protein